MTVLCYIFLVYHSRGRKRVLKLALPPPRQRRRRRGGVRDAVVPVERLHGGEVLRVAGHRRAHAVRPARLLLLVLQQRRVPGRDLRGKPVRLDEKRRGLRRRKLGNGGVVRLEAPDVVFVFGNVEQRALDFTTSRAPRGVRLVDVVVRHHAARHRYLSRRSRVRKTRLTRVRLTHVLPVRNAARAAVLQRLVAFNAPQLVHRRYLEQEPRAGGGGVRERLVVVVEHVPRGELQQRHVVHEQHHSVRGLVALARGL
mmetsp:Transcript_3630/g.14628  ORF Transcript_3630/g.14628 Transcript_3630/m.14628 type:complete len:255 (-) Transcript_3630:956-1720(-)